MNGSDPTTMANLVTVSSYDDVLEAHLAGICLEDAGIPSYVADANVVNTYWLYTLAVGGMKIQVEEQNLPKALQVLADLKSSAVAGKEAIYGDCPACNSRKVEVTRYKKRLSLAFCIPFGFPLPFLWRPLKCQECHHTWQPTTSSGSSFAFVFPLLAVCLTLGAAAAVVLSFAKP